jgi:hypothetical protein
MPRDPDALRPRTRPVLIAAAAVLALVLVLTFGVVLGRDHAPQHGVSASGSSKSPFAIPPMVTASSATSTAPAPDSSPPTTPASRTPSVATEQCPRGLVSDALPAQSATDITWHATAVAPVPVSPTYGPLRTDSDALPICFSHSPMGAAIAVETIDAWLFSTRWRTVLATHVAQTPGYAEFLTALEADPPDGSPDIDTLVGFNVVAYTPAVASIELVYRGSNGGLVGCPVSAQWTRGDWQLATRPDGTITPATCPSVDPGTFIAWGPGT